MYSYIIQTWIRFLCLIGLETWVWLLWWPCFIHLGFTSCGATPYQNYVCPISKKSDESNYIDISFFIWQFPDWTGSEDMVSLIAMLSTLRVLFVWWNIISTVLVSNLRENLSKQRYWYIFEKKIGIFARPQSNFAMVMRRRRRKRHDFRF